MRTERVTKWYTRKWRAVSLLAVGVLSISAVTARDTSNAASEHEHDANPLVISVEIPRLNVSEYHRPYIAVWIENDARELQEHVAVWYQQDRGREGHGKKWLPDLRQWWRRGGRDLDVPVDGISGATRPAGTHEIKVPIELLRELSPNSYVLVVEASREVGGREVVKLPFQWPIEKLNVSRKSGKSELGKITLRPLTVSQP